MKAVLPGPITYAVLAEDRAYKNFEMLARAVSEALHQEALALQEAGAPLIQIDEPALGGQPARLALARACMETIARGLKTKVGIATYFKPVQEIWTGLRAFPVQVWQVDVADRPAQLDMVLNAPPDGEVVFGCMDARNTRLEERDTLARTLERATDRLGADRVWASPNAGLEFLPHATAQKKMARLAEAVGAVNGRTAGTAAR